MATLKVKKNRLNADGEYDRIHYETDASVVLMEDGRTVQEAADIQSYDITAISNDLDVLNTYIGTLPEEAESTNVVNYIAEKITDSLPVKVEILETICKNLEVNTSYEFPEPIMLDEDGLYWLEYKYYDELWSAFSKPVKDTDGLTVSWFQNDFPVFLTSTSITDNYLSGFSTRLSIYKVSVTLSDYLLHDAMNIEGYNTIASGIFSHAEGAYSEANGPYSHAEGYHSLANSPYQHVEGKWNTADGNSKYLHIIGNGTGEASRSNAHTLGADGTAWFAGEVYTGGTEQSEGTKLATVDEVGELINEAIAQEPFDKVFKYRWRKEGTVEEWIRVEGKEETVTVPTNWLVGVMNQGVVNSGDSNTMVYYADTYTFDTATLSLTLENALTLGPFNSNTDTELLNSVKGKYWSKEGTTGLSTVYYTQTDADDAIHSSTTTTISSTASQIQYHDDIVATSISHQYCLTKSGWENIWADTEDAYPHSGEVITYEDDTRTEKIKYDYEGRPYDTLIDGTCELIQWVGTGTFGAENPTVLTFRGTPRLVLIYDTALPAFHILLRPLATGRCTGTSSSSSFDFIDNAVWDENTLTWYHDESSFDSYDDTAIYQQQKANTEYYALAFYK